MNEQQITSLYEAKRDYLLKRYTFLCNSSVMDAEDILQETFARLLTYKESIPEEPEEAEKYLQRMAYNCFLANRRENQRSGTVDYDELAEESFVTEEDARLGEVQELIKHLDVVLNSYPEQEKTAMRLHFLKKYRSGDLMAIFGGSKGYWSKLSNSVYDRLKAFQERGAYFSKGSWVGCQ